MKTLAEQLVRANFSTDWEYEEYIREQREKREREAKALVKIVFTDAGMVEFCSAEINALINQMAKYRRSGE